MTILKKFLDGLKRFLIGFSVGVLLITLVILVSCLSAYLLEKSNSVIAFIPIFIFSFILVFLVFYLHTKNSLKQKKEVFEVIGIMKKNIINGIEDFIENTKILFKKMLKIMVWLILAVIIVSILWGFGSFVVGLSATTVIIILLVLILLK